MKKFSLGIALALAVLTSCSKDDPAPAPATPALVPKTITTVCNSCTPVTTSTSTVTYDGNKIVSEVETDGSKRNYTYTGDNITKIESLAADGTTVTSTSTYTYNEAGALTKSERVSAKGNTTTTTTYTYNADGTLATQVSEDKYYNGATPPVLTTSTSTTTYSKEADGRIKGVRTSGTSTTPTYYTYDANGNRTKSESSYGTATSGSTNIDVYTYDDKRIPTSGITGMSKLNVQPGGFVASNNRISSESTNKYTSNSVTTTTVSKSRNEMKYNDSGYPTEIKSYSTGSSVGATEALTKTDTYAY